MAQKHVPYKNKMLMIIAAVCTTFIHASQPHSTVTQQEMDAYTAALQLYLPEIRLIAHLDNYKTYQTQMRDHAVVVLIHRARHSSKDDFERYIQPRQKDIKNKGLDKTILALHQGILDKALYNEILYPHETSCFFCFKESSTIGFKRLLDLGANPCVVYDTDYDARSGLHLLVDTGHVDRLKILIDTHPTLVEEAYPGFTEGTLLHGAVLAVQPKVVALLLKKGAQKDKAAQMHTNNWAPVGHYTPYELTEALLAIWAVEDTSSKNKLKVIAKNLASTNTKRH